MKELLTPKQVARAIQVSESSVKRWCDRGEINTQYTVGGHRRIPISALLAFLRSTRHQLVRPEVVGLPATVGQTEWVLDRAADQFTAALLEGDEEQCQRIVIDLYVAEHSVAKICDQVMATAFQRIGSQWECGAAEIYQERRACEVCRRVLFTLRSLISPPGPLPLAFGGTVDGDAYTLPTAMVELVLRDANWNATSLGCNLPFDTLAAALRRQHPRLFWLSVSHLTDVDRFLTGYKTLYEAFGMDTAFVVGGRALTESIRREMQYAAYCDNMQHLEGFAHSLTVETAQPTG